MKKILLDTAFLGSYNAESLIPLQKKNGRSGFCPQYLLTVPPNSAEINNLDVECREGDSVHE